MKLIIAVILLAATSASASFEATNLRYLSGAEVIDKVYQLLPKALEKSKIHNANTCDIDEKSIFSAGSNNPVTGHSIYLSPSTAFYSWYDKCLSATVLSELEDIQTEEVGRRHLGPLFGKTHLYANPTKEELATLVAYQMNRILGPDEVILEYGYTTDCDQFRKNLAHEASNQGYLLAILKYLEIELMKRDEFLSY